MTDLRKLLIEARDAVDAIRNEHKTHGHITDASAHWLIKVKPRIDAALAEKVEGGTPEDLTILRAANLQFAETEHRLRTALRFYANGHHMDISGDPDAWDTVSGEPVNFWCDEAGTATIEDGTIAKMALLNQPIEWTDEDGDDQTPPEIEGEYPEIDRARSAK